MSVVNASPHKKGVVCETCGSGFAKQSNLNRHVGTKHTDQTTPEAVAKRLKVQEYRKTNRRERVNHVLNGRTYRMNKKARVQACAVGGADAGPSWATSITEDDEDVADENKGSGSTPWPDAKRIPTGIVWEGDNVGDKIEALWPHPAFLILFFMSTSLCYKSG